jgi:hypothetical protein
MKNSCSIVIPHINTPHLLYGSIDQIIRLTDNIDWEVIIADQSGVDIHNEIMIKYQRNANIKVIHLKKVDAGFPIDVAARTSNKEFLCSLDTDAFPIHKNWLYLPIQLIKEFNLSFVGSDTGLGSASVYVDAHGQFCHLNNYFRVSRTSLARSVSENAGFCRIQHQRDTGLSYANVGWKLDHADNGVVAQWWADQMSLGNKVGLALNKILGMTNEFGVYGMCIDDLVFHFVFGYHPDTINDANKSLGQTYLALERKIKQEGLTQVNIDALLQQLKPHHPYDSRIIGYHGPSQQLQRTDPIYQRIEELKSLEVV